VFYCFLLYSSTTSIRINDVNKLCSPLFHFFTLKKQTLSSPSTNTFKEKKYRLLIYYIVRNLPREGACTNRQKTLVPIKKLFLLHHFNKYLTLFLLHHLNKYLTLTFCSFIKSLKIKKMIHKKTKQSSFIIYPLNLNESLKPPGETLMHVYPLESRLLHRTGTPPPLFPNTRTKNPSPKMLCF
jgi:hypothetical protein